MSGLDRRTFVQSAALASVLGSVFETTSVEAAEKGSYYYVIAELVAKPGSENDLRELLVPFAKKARAEPGCRRYTLLEVSAEPGRFLTFETWLNKAALDVHMTTPHIKAIVPKLEPVLAKPFTQTFLGALTGA